MALTPPTRRPVMLSPIGVARYVHLNKPDVYTDPNTGKQARPRYKTQLLLDGDDRDLFKQLIDKLVDEAYEAHTANMPKSKKDKITKYYPYEEELDEDDNPTGRLAFRFAMNAEIEVKGEIIKRQPLLVDSKKLPCKVTVWSTSDIRVAYTTRDWINAATKQVGISLDLVKVQIIRLAERSERPDNTFDEVEGGFSAAELSTHDDPAPDNDDDLPF